MTAPLAAPRRPDRNVLRFLPAVTLSAVVTVTSTSEWTLARTVLDLPPAVAWAVPVAIDSYVIAALRTRRDVLPAVLVMAGALAAAMGAHLAAAGQDGGSLPVRITAPAAALILSVLVIVAWRVHVLIDHLTGHHPTPVPVLATPVPVPPWQPVPGGPSQSTGPVVPTAAVEAGSAGTGGPVAAAPRPAVPATPSTAADIGVPDEPATTRTGLSDEQILADLTSDGEATSPGIRALKRTYAIGQTRAARIHQQITDQPNKNSSKEQQNSPTTNQKNHQPEIESADSEDDDKPIQATAIQKYTENDQEQTHIGITDRVGQSRSTTEYGTEPFPALFRVGGDG